MRRKLAAVAAATLFPVIAMLAYNEYATRQQRNEEVRAQASQAARQASSEVERILEGLHSLLIATSALDGVETRNRSDCTDDLKRVASQVPSIRTIIVLDLQGKLVCDSLGTPVGLDLSDRSYFKLALTSDDYVVGGYTKSRISDQPILPVAMPLKQDGVTNGVIVTGLRLEWLQQRMKERGVIEGNAVTVADSEGVILAREPFPERFVGTRIPDAFQALIHAPGAGVIEVKSQDGTERVLGYQPINIPSNRLYIGAGISKEEAFAPINRSTIIGILSIIGGAILAFVASTLVGNRFILKPIFHIADVLERWRAGEIQARTAMHGRDELHVVGASLDRLLDELQLRGEEAQRAEAARSLVASELSHRVKNTLAIIQAIARQNFRNQSPDGYRSFSERVAALANGYDLLFAEEHQQGHVSDTIERALRPHRGENDQRFTIDGPAIVLPAQLVLSLSLVIHELATNATKYGALRDAEGHIDITWAMTGDRLKLHWHEIDGPPVEPPASEGFGSRLIKSAFPAGARPDVEFKFEPTGLSFTLTFVVENVQAA